MNQYNLEHMLKTKLVIMMTLLHISSVSDPSRFWCGSGSGSWDPHLVKVDPDPDPRIHLSIIVDPDPDPRIHILKKWIRIRIWIRVLWIFFDYDYFSSSLKWWHMRLKEWHRNNSISSITIFINMLTIRWRWWKNI